MNTKRDPRSYKSSAGFFLPFRCWSKARTTYHFPGFRDQVSDEVSDRRAVLRSLMTDSKSNNSFLCRCSKACINISCASEKTPLSRGGEWTAAGPYQISDIIPLRINTGFPKYLFLILYIPFLKTGMASPSAGLSVRLLLRIFPHRQPWISPIRSRAGSSLLFPPSACAAEYQQRQSAFGFLPFSRACFTCRDQITPSLHFQLADGTFLDTRSNPKNVWIVRQKRFAAKIARLFRRSIFLR